MGADVVAYGEGPFQYMLAFSTFAAMATFLTHAFSFRLTARTMNHWCRPPDHLSNLSDVTWKELAIPTDDKGNRSRCTMLDPPDTGDASAVLVPCSSWKFDLEEYGDTIVSKWSLVCDRKWLLTLALTLYATSPVVWLPMVGIAADTFGRKGVTYISVPVLVVAAAGSSMTNSFALFVVMRIVVSVTSTSVLVLVYTLLYEVSSPGRRMVYWLTSSALAYISLPLFFFMANTLKLSWDSVYRFLAAMTCVLLVFFYTVDESPRWLLVKWKIHKAERVALRAARLNGIPMQECLGKLDMGGAELPKVEPGLKGKIFTICEPNLRSRTALLSFIWLVFTCAYNVVNLTRIISPNIIVSVVNIVLIGPAQLLLYPCVRNFGVKRTAVVISVAFTLLALVLALLYREQQALLLTIELAIPTHDIDTPSPMFDPPDTGDASAVLVQCSSRKFDLEEYGDIILSQWSLVCGQKWLVTLALALCSTSPVVWLPNVGIVTDGRHGRHRPEGRHLHLATCARSGRSRQQHDQFLTSSALAYISLSLFFFTANSLKLSWDSVYGFLAAMTCVPLVFCTVDETPRCLLVKWKIHKAERVALRAARLNGISMQECLRKLDMGVAELHKVEPAIKNKSFTICEPNYGAALPCCPLFGSS
ncbi:hypothetical protein HPB49_001288 [Dermacentor silvarum]|uniref:Uncharacterized protein n=1 Tax=Dermacentor silvarum TaxID=543639 RepID=A0ACB8C0W5_DERSI|nr:hypothetical protein HPB49_001288 [Dermacentor silvarum]